MGFFSFVGKAVKAIGKVAAPVLKALASKATGGLSDSLLKKLKGNPGKLSPTQAEALIEKTGGYTPRVVSTESGRTSAGREEGWGFGKQPQAKTARAIKRKPAQRAPVRPTTARMAAPAPRAKARALVSRRGPPAGGLDLKALSLSWKKAGKPGTWQAWIQANK